MKNLIPVFAFAAAALSAQTFVIRNATVHTITQGTLQGASVVVKDGKIAEVGANVLVPPGASVVDASGMHLMPGIIDSHVHYGADATNEGSVSVSSMVAIGDVINPESPAIYHALSGGVTTALVLHGSANSIGGQSSTIKMRWGKDANGLLFKESPPGIKFALGENVKRAGQSQSQLPGANQNLRYPGTRLGVEDTIREAFIEARQYQASWKEYEARKAKGEDVLPPRRDLKLEPLVEVLEGKRLVHAHCYRSDEILMLIRVADEFGFKIATLQHVLEGYKVAKEIAAHGAGASTFSDWWAYKIEAYDAIPYNAAVMWKKGVTVALNSDDLQADLTRRLNVEAAKVIKYGVDDENEALKMITINAAKMMKIDQYVGSIEVGKMADLVLFDKHPLSTLAKVQKVFIDGQPYFDRDKDMTTRADKSKAKTQLIEKEKAGERRPGAGGPPAGARRPNGGAL